MIAYEYTRPSACWDLNCWRHYAWVRTIPRTGEERIGFRLFGHSIEWPTKAPQCGKEKMRR